MAEASLRYVIVHGEARFSRTEYICGRNSRSEYRNGPFLVGGDPKRPETMQLEFGPRRALIHNRDLGYRFDIDLESRVYTAFELHEYRRPGVTSFTPKVESHEPSGRNVHVRTETTDTGERKEMFGYTARRVIIRTTYRYSPDDDALSRDSEADGWYIDPPAAWLAVHPSRPGHAILHLRFDTPVFTDAGPRETGFPMLVTRTHRSSFTDAEGKIRIHTSGDREEITEFSEETLESDLFVPPRDFRRVLRLPGEGPLPLALRMRLRWENLKDTFLAKY